MERDGDYFQWVQAGVSGIGLAVSRKGGKVTTGRFWACFAVVAAESLPAAIRSNAIPLVDPLAAFTITPDVAAVERHGEAGGPLDDLRADTVIAAFDL